ncbi:MAG TPA: Ig-like domain-containing protein [Candidatus Solibacter sp.]|nr:Ig-like domain-containing protein [Candidatus Solibacter sp.]
MALTLLGISAVHAATTYTFKNGSNSYSSSADFSINTQYAESNGGNGVRWTGGSQLGLYNVAGSGGYQVRYLLKFGNLTVPAGSQVVSATLTMTVEAWFNGGGNITGYYLKNSWNPASNRMGWIHRNATNDWAAPGASAAGVDTVAGKSFQFPALRNAGAQTLTITLDPAVVQSWIDSSAADQGIMLVNNNIDEVVRPMATTGTASQRPILTIVANSGVPTVSVSVSPTTATVQTGATQQFNATVTGSSNTAVNWTATGGTISNTGLFTAGQTAGSFTVTATSAADTTKKATATVTVQAPVVSVSITPTTATLQTGATQQFNASVTGSSNAAVTWSATGGTISNTGLFAAGQTTGSFTVTATSAADTTKSASATVTVQAPVVSVSITPTTATLQTGVTQQFSATVTGSSNTAVTWTATGGTISSTGLYTAGQTTGNFAVTARSAADTTKSATATVQIATATTGLPPVPRMFDGAYVVVQSPASGMHFTAPGTIRIFADPFDPNASDPDALTVNFLLNGQSVGTFTGSGANNGLFPMTVNNLAAGTYAITAQITAGGRVVTSFPVTVFVDNPAASSGPVYNLTADMVLSGTQAMSYVGTPTNHCLVNGNGFQIRSAAGFTGSLNITSCDIRNLGSASTRAIDVTVNGGGSVQLIGNVFDTYGAVAIGANNSAQAVIRGNEFRANTLVAVGSQPSDTSTETIPVFTATGNSTLQKFFQGNNVGLSTVFFDATTNWLIGGSTDADSNVLMGVRCGFTISRSSNMVLRGNYSQHNYPHRFSQGENFQLDGDGFLVEHNVIRSSSWPVRGVGGEVRYNLIDNSGNSDQVFQAPMSNTNIHHNIFTFTVSQTFYSPGAGLRVMYNVDNVQFHNNTMDGGGTFMSFSGPPVSVLAGSFLGSLRNNVIYNYAGLTGDPVIAGDLGESTNPPLARMRYADYNAFYNPDAPNQTNYGLGVIGLAPGAAGYGMHDAGGFNGHVSPKFTNPTVLPFPFRAEDIWNRVKKVSDVLATYRSMYAPATGSPLIGAGDPQDGPGNIGAVGNGEPADQFGKFGNGSGTPASPVIAAFTATPAAVQTGQSATLNWSVTGADTISIAPGIGTVTGTSTTVTPSAATTYTLTATNSGGSTTASTTVAVSATPIVSISISPTSASVTANSTRQFTATVTGSTNTGVTWTATGGTISPAGLFTAGATTGSFTVKATSVADTTKSATATVTITAPQPVSVSVSPTSATLFPNGTQQFTATVNNATNTAVSWIATGGAISAAGLFTAGTATGTFTVTATSVQDSTKSASAAITIVTQTTSNHPRIILDAPTLANLRSRAAANTPEWTAIKNICNSFIGGGSVLFPGDNGYPNPPSVGEGYQGSGYVEALMPLALCYQMTMQSNPTQAAQYGQKGVAILMAMSDPNHTIVDGQPVWDRDSGYGIRNYGFTMGMGYDWLHDLMTPAQLAQVRTSLQNWIAGFETDSFEYDHPQGNYFAGYYVSKCMAALAVQGDDPIGDTWWNDWYTHQHLQRVQPYYALNLGGGGWTEGFTQYGILSVRNQTLPVLAVKTAKGLDLMTGTQPYTYPTETARWLMHFTWPTRNMFDDRGELYDSGDPNIWPGTARLETYRMFAGFLAMYNDPLAPMMHKYAKDVKTALDALNASDSTEWVDFLFWDNSAADADYSTLAMSYLAPGEGGVAARSDWSSAATFLSFMSGPYINNPAAGHEAFDKGSLAIERNKNPLVVNPDAWITHEPNGGSGWNLTYDDRYGNWDIDHTLGNRTLYNTFQVRHLDGQGHILDNYGEWALQRDDGVRTKIGRFEDGGSYVLVVGQFLEDMYRPFSTVCANVSPITSWSRQILYLRPSQFVVYDRTGICNSSLDQYLAFHFPASPVELASPGAGVRRFDVTNGLFAGAMSVVLPASAGITTTDRMSTDTTTWNKMWRTEIRPTGTAAASRQWLTVFDLAGTSPQVASATPVNIVSGPAVGALLESAAGNTATVFGTAPVGMAIGGTLAYGVPAAQTRHVITDLTPSGSYAVSVTVSGANHVVTVTPGGSLHASANGVLTFNVTAGGVVQ